MYIKKIGKTSPKSIMCFGDSNTYGYDYRNGGRLDENTRWTGILKNSLNDIGINVIECGRNGRTTVFSDDAPDKNGSEILPILLRDNYPLAYAVVMLGTNDCKIKFSASADMINNGIEIIINQIKLFDNRTKIILVSPVFLSESIFNDYFTGEFDRESIKKSISLKELIRRTAEKNDCIFLAASDIADTENTDGVHLDIDGHTALANELKHIILECEGK